MGTPILNIAEHELFSSNQSCTKLVRQLGNSHETNQHGRIIGAAQSLQTFALAREFRRVASTNRHAFEAASHSVYEGLELDLRTQASRAFFDRLTANHSKTSRTS
jgi:hypothetical protein